MKYEITDSRCIITASSSTERFYADTAFFYALKVAMQAAGLDVIKRRMWKDGHMVDDCDYYIRDRKWRFCVHDADSQIRAVYTAFNDNRAVNLTYVDWSK